MSSISKLQTQLKSLREDRRKALAEEQEIIAASTATKLEKNALRQRQLNGEISDVERELRQLTAQPSDEERELQQAIKANMRQEHGMVQAIGYLSEKYVRLDAEEGLQQEIDAKKKRVEEIYAIKNRLPAMADLSSSLKDELYELAKDMEDVEAKQRHARAGAQVAELRAARQKMAERLAELARLRDPTRLAG